LKKSVLTFDIEKEFLLKGYKVICGTDEAGRGPLAGDVYAAACILPLDFEIEGLNDSKKLSETRREELFDKICSLAVAYSIQTASVEEIDTLNILNAAQLAMRRAVESLTLSPDAVLVDGNVARGFNIPAFPVVKGDSKSPSIAAASILAKVARDRAMLMLDRLYPEYGFAKHKGYPTKEHMEAVRKFGPSPVHRKTFLKFLNK